MDNIVANRDMINKILHLLPLDDLMNVRRLTREYKTFVDTHCADKFTIMRFEPIPDKYFEENIGINSIIDRIKKYLKEHDELDSKLGFADYRIINGKFVLYNPGKRKKIHFIYHVYSYIMGHFENIKNELLANKLVFMRFLCVSIHKMMFDYISDFRKFSITRTFTAKFCNIYRQIFIENPIDYLVYYQDSLESFPQTYLDIDDILNLRLVNRKLLYKYRDVSKYGDYVNSMPMSIAVNKPAKFSKRKLFKDKTRINDIIASLDSIQYPNRYVKCNRLANDINYCIKYMKKIDHLCLKTVYDKLQIMINNGWMATEKLRVVSAAFIRHIDEYQK